MAMANQENRKKQDMQTRILPKNFRQIGDPGSKKIYMEDYVYTYLNKLAQPGNLYARGAILFGKMYRTAAGNCLFISGAAACQNFEFDLEETVFSEEMWNEIYQTRDKFFPEQEVAGWFLSRMGFSVELNDKIIRMHMDNFSGENKVLYMMDVLENEDAFYQMENYSLKKQRGYYIYYETNKEMKEYMLAEGEPEKEPELKRKSAAILRDSSVVKNYKKAMRQKKKVSQKSGGRLTPSAVAGGLVMMAVLVYGARSVYRFRSQEASRQVFGQQEPVVWEETGTMENTSETTEELQDTLSKQNTENENTQEASTQIPVWLQNHSGLSEENPLGQESDSQSSSQEDDSSTKEDTGEEASTEDTDVFTQEEPDDAKEAWSYIGGQYTVQQGDTLAAISKKIYESYQYIDLIAEANNIENVDQIYPGQVLDIPEIED